MRRFTPRPPSPAIDNCQFRGIACPTRIPREMNWLADPKFDAPRQTLAMHVQRPEIIQSRPKLLRQPDSEHACRHRRRDGHDRIRQLCVTGLVDQDHLRLDHEVTVSRRDDAVLEFDEMNGCNHGCNENTEAMRKRYVVTARRSTCNCRNGLRQFTS